MNTSEGVTKLQSREDLYDAWVAAGSIGEPPERPVWRNREHRISAMIDPFSQWKLGVVIYDHDGTRGEEAHLWQLNPSRLVKVTLVARAVGNKILDVDPHYLEEQGMPDARALARVDGFQIPDNAHLVMRAGEQGAEPSPLPTDPIEKAAELNHRWELLRFTEVETSTLEAQLAWVDTIAHPLDMGVDPRIHY